MRHCLTSWDWAWIAWNTTDPIAMSVASHTWPTLPTERTTNLVLIICATIWHIRQRSRFNESITMQWSTRRIAYWLTMLERHWLSLALHPKAISNSLKPLNPASKNWLKPKNDLSILLWLKPKNWSQQETTDTKKEKVDLPCCVPTEVYQRTKPSSNYWVKAA